MTKEEMIELAKQSGWKYAHGESGFEPLWAFARLVAEHERERCAEICECSFNEKNDNFNYHATLIRARGQA